MKLQIIKYKNRKLYCQNTSSYVNHKDIAKAIRSGAEVKVTNYDTKEDITNIVLVTMLHQVNKLKLLSLDTSQLIEKVRDSVGSMFTVERTLVEEDNETTTISAT